MKRLIAIALAALLSTPALAGFFDGYSATLPGDQDTINYAADLEGRGYNQFSTIVVTPTLNVAGAATQSADAFTDAVKAAVRSVHKVPTDCVTQTPTNVGLYSGWTMYNDEKRPGEFWTNRLYYREPVSAPGTWKRPVVVINDGLGVAYSTGILSRGIPGENVAQMLLNDGHPVMVMALKGMDDKYFTGGWGIGGLDQFETFLRARNDSTVSVWIRDAYDAVCLMQQWFPNQQIDLTGVSKSGIVAASVALLLPAVTKVYLASGFSAFEAKFYGVNPWTYGFGERGLYERNAVVLALWEKSVRLSYSNTNDDISYRIEALEGRTLNAINYARAVWGKPVIYQFSTAPSHYYNATDITSFFGE